MSLHQARHGFCNLLSCALFKINTPFADRFTESLDKESVRKVLLGYHDLPSRRGSMAIARALGHQSPRTQLRSYSRMMTEWADRLTPVTSHYTGTVSNAIQVDRWRVTPANEVESGAQNIFSQRTKLTPLTVMEALRLMALGYSVRRIESMLRLYPGELADIEILVDRINAGLRFKVYDPEQMKKAYVYGASLPKYLLKSRSTTVWPRLLQLCEHLPTYDELGKNRPLPSLDQSSNLVGRNGHLLMNDMEDANLVRFLVDAFSLSEDSYTAVIKSKPSNAARAQNVLLSAGFVAAAVSNVQLDTFNADHDPSFSRGRSYAGLVLTTPVAGQIHDRLELVLLFIAVASAYCPRPNPLSPLTVLPNTH